MKIIDKSNMVCKWWKNIIIIFSMFVFLFNCLLNRTFGKRFVLKWLLNLFYTCFLRDIDLQLFIIILCCGLSESLIIQISNFIDPRNWKYIHFWILYISRNLKDFYGEYLRRQTGNHKLPSIYLIYHKKMSIFFLSLIFFRL